MASINDWAAKAAKQIEAEYTFCDGKSYRPSRERVAAIIALHAEPLVALLREAHNGHHSKGWSDEGCDYAPCRKSEDDRLDAEECNCGADTWNARVEAALDGADPGKK